jgi:hypothetical protein
MTRRKKRARDPFAGVRILDPVRFKWTIIPPFKGATRDMNPEYEAALRSWSVGVATDPPCLCLVCGHEWREVNVGPPPVVFFALRAMLSTRAVLSAVCVECFSFANRERLAEAIDRTLIELCGPGAHVVMGDVHLVVPDRTAPPDPPSRKTDTS